VPAGVMLADARRLMRKGDFYAAAAQYEQLRRAHSSSAEAHAALVSLAQLELDKLGQPRRALARLDRYLAQSGDLEQEARHARIRALRSLREPRLERAAIEEFLELYPRSFQRKALSRRLAELAETNEQQ